MTDEQPTLTPAQQAQATLEADRRQRAQRASDEIAAILKREDCDLLGVPRYVPDGASGWKTMIDITIVAK